MVNLAFQVLKKSVRIVFPGDPDFLLGEWRKSSTQNYPKLVWWRFQDCTDEMQVVLFDFFPLSILYHLGTHECQPLPRPALFQRAKSSFSIAVKGCCFAVVDKHHLACQASCLSRPFHFHVAFISSIVDHGATLWGAMWNGKLAPSLLYCRPHTKRSKQP